MLKKSVEAKSQQRLSAADRNKLKRKIKQRFPNASDSDLDILIPPKVEITVSKQPNRVLIYRLEGGGMPIFFDVDTRGRTTIFPTVYALWKVPHLLPAFILKGGEVSRYVIKGADLMFSGISINAEGLPEFLAGESWAVVVPGNPAPIAVGSTCMSSSEALKAGLHGKALKISHHYRDALWESAEDRYAPNAGFLEDVVFEDPSLSTTSEQYDAEVTGDHEIDADNRESEVLLNDSVASQSLTDSSSRVQLNPNLEEQVTSDLDDLKVTESDKVVTEGQINLSVEDVDALLDKCLLQAFYTTLKDKDLPIAGSTLWTSHVLPCRPPGTMLDFKKSSHKKLSKWLQSKSSEGLISSKEDKHKKEVMVLAINRKHPDYTSFKPEKEQFEKKEQIDEPINETIINGLLQVIEIYKPSVHVNPIFKSVGADTRQLYTQSEANEVVFAYIEKENLVHPTNKSIVVLDTILCDALFKGAIKKGCTYPSEIHKKDLASTFINRMQAHHQVTRGKETVVRKGGLKPLQIMTERRQGNKKVTKLSGMESFLIDAEPLASELQKKFACSTSVTELPGKLEKRVTRSSCCIDLDHSNHGCSGERILKEGANISKGKSLKNKGKHNKKSRDSNPDQFNTLTYDDKRSKAVLSITENRVLDDELSKKDGDKIKNRVAVTTAVVVQEGSMNVRDVDKKEKNIGVKRTRNQLENITGITQGWTKDQELALERAYLEAKPTPHFWKKVSRLVPGKSAQDCFDKIHGSHLTPPQPRTRFRARVSNPENPFISTSKLLNTSSPTTKKPRYRKQKSHVIQRTVRHMLQNQYKLEHDSQSDLFSLLEPTFTPFVNLNLMLTTPDRNQEAGDAHKRCSTVTRSASRFSSPHGTMLVSPPVLKQVKNKALHEKYIDLLNCREANRKAAASAKAGKANKYKLVKQESSVERKDAVKAAKNALVFGAKDAINDFQHQQAAALNDLFYCESGDDADEDNDQIF